VYGFGCNEEGQLGLGDTKNRFEPTEIKFLENFDLFGSDHNFAIQNFKINTLL
jgi:hypothetical protein